MQHERDYSCPAQPQVSLFLHFQKAHQKYKKILELNLQNIFLPSAARTLFFCPVQQDFVFFLSVFIWGNNKCLLFKHVSKHSRNNTETLQTVKSTDLFFAPRQENIIHPKNNTEKPQTLKKYRTFFLPSAARTQFFCPAQREVVLIVCVFYSTVKYSSQKMRYFTCV